MNKIAVAYFSQHHNNTEKIVKSAFENESVDLFRLPEDKPDLSKYEVVGFASGIYMGKPHQSVIDTITSLNGKGKKAFYLYTCGSPKGNYGYKLESLLKSRDFEVVGSFHCRGFDTYGPFKLIGGTAKGRPNREDESNAKAFFETIKKQYFSDTEDL